CAPSSSATCTSGPPRARTPCGAPRRSRRCRRRSPGPTGSCCSATP
ncbi:MAG: hypothetical protein AVDCRST_MAG13-1363, partial [uncultured Solirubrobacteraceae bacterium]